MALLARKELEPDHAFVELSDPLGRDYPYWPEGEQVVAALPECIGAGRHGVRVFVDTPGHAEMVQFVVAPPDAR